MQTNVRNDVIRRQLCRRDAVYGPSRDRLGRIQGGQLPVRAGLADDSSRVFTTHEAQQMIRSLRGLQLYGGDVVEVAPPFDPSGTTALVGASIMFEILCVVSESVASRK